MPKSFKTTEFVTPVIYFKSNDKKVYLLVKPHLQSNWQLPQLPKFQTNEESIYRMLEDYFAISRKQVNSIQKPLRIEIQEEAVIVPSSEFADYAWETEDCIGTKIGHNNTPNYLK